MSIDGHGFIMILVNLRDLLNYRTNWYYFSDSVLDGIWDDHVPYVHNLFRFRS